MLIGNIAQQMYNTVDSIVVGKYVGDNALAAVGSASPILNLLLVLFIGISVGASIMVSQYFGAREKEELASTVGTCVTLRLGVCPDNACGAFGSTAAAPSFEYAGEYFLLVQGLSEYFIYRCGGACLLQYSERYFAWAGEIPISALA